MKPSRGRIRFWRWSWTATFCSESAHAHWYLGIPQFVKHGRFVTDTLLRRTTDLVTTARNASSVEILIFPARYKNPSMNPQNSTSKPPGAALDIPPKPFRQKPSPPLKKGSKVEALI